MNNKKFTKIIITIGPACDSKEKLTELYKAGMNIVRLNFSHGTKEYFEKVVKTIRSVSEEIAILLDTKGPEIRSGDVEAGSINLIKGENIILTNEEVIGNIDKLTINYNNLGDLDVGNTLLIDDGIIETKIIKKIDKNSILVKILNDGILGSKKTISIRGHSVNIEFLSKKDKDDILLGIELGVDLIAASFVRKSEDVKSIRKLLDKNGGEEIKIISKIEHQEAIKNIDKIISSSIGIMVARGDLGVEMPIEKVPKLQMEIIQKCKELGKPVIVATQMLESMKENSTPTRAEVGDVAQAILQGADAVMLSGETAVGKYPVKAVKTMTSIAMEYDKQVENNILKLPPISLLNEKIKDPIATFIAKAAYLATINLNARAILVTTESGFSARKISRFKSKSPIYAITHSKTILRQLQLSWGVFPMIDPHHHKFHDGMVNELVKKCINMKLLNKNDKVVVTSGHILSQKGHTNILEIYEVNSILNRCEKDKE